MTVLPPQSAQGVSVPSNGLAKRLHRVSSQSRHRTPCIIEGIPTGTPDKTAVGAPDNGGERAGQRR